MIENVLFNFDSELEKKSKAINIKYQFPYKSQIIKLVVQQRYIYFKYQLELSIWHSFSKAISYKLKRIA